MHAFLITQSTPEKRISRAEELIRQLAEKNIESRNKFLLARDPEKKSIGIEDTIGLKHWLAQKTGKLRAAIIEEGQSLTIPAQQSLLKAIEEPGDLTLIILTADSEMSLLPTIRSRCKVIRMPNAGCRVPNDKQEIFVGFPFDRGAGERILWLYGKLSEFSGKKISPHQGSIGRETGIIFMEKIIEEVRVNPPAGEAESQESSMKTARILDEAAKAHRRLKQNISPTLVLQEFVLNI